MNQISNQIGEVIVRTVGGSFLDKKNIKWKNIDGKWIGKRSVWTYDFTACWLEETTLDRIKSWWCGKYADYNEVFIRNKM